MEQLYFWCSHSVCMSYVAKHPQTWSLHHLTVSMCQEFGSSLAEWFWLAVVGRPSSHVTWAPLGATSALRPWQLTSPRVIDPREQGGEVTPCHWLSCSLEKLLVLVWPVLKGMVGKLPLRRGRTPKNFRAGPEATAVPENGNYNRHGREILPSGGWLDWVEVVPAKLETDVILFPLGLRVSVAPAGPALYLHPLRPPRLHDAEGSCSG